MTTTVAAALSLVLCATGLPDALVLPALVVLLAAMAGGLVTDVLVRRDWRRTTLAQRRWLSGLPGDLPEYRARVEDRERALFGWESRWWRPLGTAFLVALGAALVPFNLILPLAPDAPVDQLVSGWVAATLLVTAALVVRTVDAARKDSQGLVFPAPLPAMPAPAPSAPVRSAQEELREESIAKYVVVEEEIDPALRLARELERLTALLDEPGAPRPTLPVPADWLPAPEPEVVAAEEVPADQAVPVAEPDEATAVRPAAGGPPVGGELDATRVMPAVTETSADSAQEAPEQRTKESELDKFSKWFHAA
ncbi:hypothetical protein [Mumia sp. DW29H23]|uniref:hypothetical protein n=1 Tax=Mumia sp. DW29H23 TaxID=3421241 RepID=UPI003D694E07